MIFVKRIVVLACLAVSLHAQDFSEEMLKPGLFNLNDTNFHKTFTGFGFKFETASKYKALSALSRSSKLRFLDLPVVESKAFFSATGELNQVMLNLYNRGDRGPIPIDVYKSRIEQIRTKMNNYTKTKARRKRSVGASRKDTLTWKLNHVVFRLDHKAGKQRIDGENQYTGEYIQLYVLPPDTKSGKKGYIKKRSLANNVKREEDSSDVYIDNIPMIDQGRKGYCVCAVSARVMQYYGRQISMHEIAQLAKTDDRGTSLEEMAETIRDIKLQLKLRHTDIIETMSYYDLKNRVKDYNKAAKRLNEDQIAFDKDFPHRAFQLMDDKVLIAAVTRRQSDVQSFMRDIKKNIDDGIPLIWTVVLGIVPEPGLPQRIGYHMRLIIGYNEKSNTILFSDTWGAGHELKRMKLGAAMAITTNLYTLEPHL